MVVYECICGFAAGTATSFQRHLREARNEESGREHGLISSSGLQRTNSGGLQRNNSGGLRTTSVLAGQRGNAHTSAHTGPGPASTDLQAAGRVANRLSRANQQASSAAGAGTPGRRYPCIVPAVPGTAVESSAGGSGTWVQQYALPQDEDGGPSAASPATLANPHSRQPPARDGGGGGSAAGAQFAAAASATIGAVASAAASSPSLALRLGGSFVATLLANAGGGAGSGGGSGDASELQPSVLAPQRQSLQEPARLPPPQQQPAGGGWASPASAAVNALRTSSWRWGETLAGRSGGSGDAQLRQRQRPHSAGSGSDCSYSGSDVDAEDGDAVVVGGGVGGWRADTLARAATLRSLLLWRDTNASARVLGVGIYVVLLLGSIPAGLTYFQPATVLPALALSYLAYSAAKPAGVEAYCRLVSKQPGAVAAALATAEAGAMAHLHCGAEAAFAALLAWSAAACCLAQRALAGRSFTKSAWAVCFLWLLLFVSELRVVSQTLLAILAYAALFAIPWLFCRFRRAMDAAALATSRVVQVVLVSSDRAAYLMAGAAAFGAWALLEAAAAGVVVRLSVMAAAPLAVLVWRAGTGE